MVRLDLLALRGHLGGLLALRDLLARRARREPVSRELRARRVPWVLQDPQQDLLDPLVRKVLRARAELERLAQQDRKDLQGRREVLRDQRGRKVQQEQQV